MATPQSSSKSPPARTAHSGGTTRRRGAALENALLEAAWDELQSVGYAKLTMERVADRAGTSRAVIYRRWSNRAELVIAALRHRQQVTPGRLPDTGTLRGDLLAVLRRVHTRLSAIGPDTIVGLLADLLEDDNDYIQTQLLQGGSEVMTTILERARERGELRGELPPRVVRLPLDLLRHELLVSRRPPSQRTIDEIVDQVFLPLVLR